MWIFYRRFYKNYIFKRDFGLVAVKRVFEQYWIFLVLFILLVITALSLYPLEYLPKVRGSDKLHHLLAYASLMFFVALKMPRYWWLMGLFFVGYSGVIELLQPYVNRYGEWLDLLANAAGVLLGLLLGLFVRVLLKRFN